MKTKRAAFDPLTADLSPRFPKETYRYLFAAWDVAEGWRLVQSLTPAQRAERLVTIKLPLGMLETHQLDTDRAMSDVVDLSVPLLVGQFRNHNDTIGLMVLDGWHRVYKASRKRPRPRTLPAFLLTIEETTALEPGKGQR
jgi:hypothetical protein